MNITEYIYLINKPEAVNEKQTAVLEKIVQEFPYFQSARALYLKGLYNQNSFKYNYVLKVTAAHTADRSILFDFITSDTFVSVHKELLEQKLSDIAAITVTESEIVEPKLEVRENSVEQSILSSIKEAGQDFEIVADATDFDVEQIPAELATELEPAVVEEIAESNPIESAIETQTAPVAETIPTPEFEIEVPADPSASELAKQIVFERVPEEIIEEQVPAEFEKVADTPAEADPKRMESEANLEIGKPLEFSKDERHSFQEWLQLSKFKPIDRTTTPSDSVIPSADETPAPVERIVSEMTQETAEPEISDPDLEKQKKNDLIDRFIETSPKIPPVKHDAPLSPSVIVEPSMADNTYLMTETLARVYLEQKKYNKAIQAYQILILKYPEKSSFFADRILDIKNLQQNNK